MFSGEKILEIINAEHAGFVLRFSSGRIAQLTIRDPQGRPRISTHFLRTDNGGTGGILGGLKSVFTGSGWRRDVTSIKTSPADSRGRMRVVAMTSGGSVLIWEITWQGQPTFKGDFSAHGEIFDMLRSDPSLEATGGAATNVIDFAVQNTPRRPGEVAIVGSLGLKLLVLVALAAPDAATYALVEITLTNTITTAQRLLPLVSYAAPPIMDSLHHVQLLLPKAEHTAFVIFRHAVLLVSLAAGEGSPNNQLLSEAQRTPIPYQDVIHFRQDESLDLIAWSAEDPGAKSSAASCVVFTKSSGIVRVIANEMDHAATRVTAKSRLEQAVFFGSLAGNLLDLTRKPDVAFSDGEVEDAATDISREILTTNTPYLTTATSSMDALLDYRLKALRDLASILSRNYHPLPYKAKWRLLWDAEKMAAARALWICHERRVGKKDAKTKSLLPELLKMVHEKIKSGTDVKAGEVDPLRQWFLKDLHRMEKMTPWAYQAVHGLKKDSQVQDKQAILQLCSDSDDILFAVLETALRFRQENAAVYGIDPKTLEGGVLKPGHYEGLSEPWTSTQPIITAAQQHAERSREWAVKYYPAQDPAAAPASPDVDLADKVLHENHRVVKLCCQSTIERYRWLLEHDEQGQRAKGQEMRKWFSNTLRPGLILPLATIGLIDEGMQLAEELSDVTSLVSLSLDELQYCEDEAQDKTLKPSQEKERQARYAKRRAQVQKFADKYGEQWTNDFNKQLVKQQRYSDLLEKHYSSKRALVQSFHKDPNLARLSWINDAVEEKDFVDTSQMLIAATKYESNAWCKKSELSLAKLALLADEPSLVADVNTSVSSATPFKQELKLQNSCELGLLSIQERLYNHIHPTSQGSLDEVAAVELLMEKFGKDAVQNRSSLQKLLEHGLSQLIHHRAMEPELLIDTLTLIDQNHSDADPEDRRNVDICGREFVMALQVLNLADFGGHGKDKAEKADKERETLLKLIWKRCYVRDDWEANNNTGSKNDAVVREMLEQTALFWTLKVGNDLCKSSPLHRAASVSRDYQGHMRSMGGEHKLTRIHSTMGNYASPPHPRPEHGPRRRLFPARPRPCTPLPIRRAPRSDGSGQ